MSAESRRRKSGHAEIFFRAFPLYWAKVRGCMRSNMCVYARAGAHTYTLLSFLSSVVRVQGARRCLPQL